MSKIYQARGLSVPAGRLSRAARMGGLTTSVLGSMAVNGTRALASGQRPRARDLLLTPGNAHRITEQLAQMRGAAMKLGQLLSMEAGDFLPEELARVLAHLRADAHYMPPAQLKQVLIRNYGPDFLKRFKRFDVRPVAAASIGQVHRAVAQDGRELALKIQYPGVRAAIDSDIRNVGTLLRLSGLLPRDIDLAPLLDEARRQLHEEADYRREARQLAFFAEQLKGSTDFIVPRPHDDLSTDDILAMDFVESTPIDTLETAPQDDRDRTMSRLVALFLQELFGWRRVQTDPNFANYRYQSETGRIVLLDFGATRDIPEPLVARFHDLLTAALAGDRDRLRAGLIAIGYFSEATPPRQQDIIMAMTDLAQPVLAESGHDFGDTSVLAALRREGMRLGTDEAFREIPPFDAIYLQRKIAGLVLLATRLRARVPVRDLVTARIR
ncbi:AarF/ABC1/UbiB kinase family protein [Thalassococcus sp. CAU 1522]|uniref:AarF/ABC1/UbiB kinase family protein n=1 Tax=Thalassococcus arenae TaxID=2851652 RepID=A0ABS6N448_9RHOB|nr:AarF/ABC1/UbiB kinase family protein [Thalassococcus arenae]MBV2358792.1 AarF/ABC1/UbiB kinase family protein [Thalassococcus arenae]